MSLINEALKRAQDASYQPAVPPPPIPSYQTSSEETSRGSKSGLMVTIVVALVAALGVAMIGFRVATSLRRLKDGFGSSASAVVEKKTPPAQTSHPVPPAVQLAKVEPAPAQQAPAAPPVVQSSTATPAAATTKTSEDELVGRVMEKIKTEQSTAPSKPAELLPKLVLQGITSATDGNEAMINGVSLREGEEIEGARIISIDRRSVKLEFSGREFVLHMP